MNHDKMAFHVVPPQGLLNDPNGLIFFQGLYHVFFQWNPTQCDHSFKCWGHATSTDLLHFDYHPAALVPDTEYDSHGCYSGSAIVIDDALYVYYTGNVFDEAHQRQSYQCLAISHDGFTFEKMGPVLNLPEAYTAHFRDPKVFRDRDGVLTMVIGAQRLDESGTIVVATSPDGVNWNVANELLETPLDMGYMWECPDLILNEPYDILLFSPQGVPRGNTKFQNIFHSGYLLGTYNQGIFTAASEFEELDYGFEFYAPQSMLNHQGKPIISGWVGAMEKEKETSIPTLQEHWVHHISLFRELSLVDGLLMQKPCSQLMSRLRAETSRNAPRGTMNISTVGVVELLSNEPLKDLLISLSDVIQLSYHSHEQCLLVQRKSWVDGFNEFRNVPLPLGLRSMLLILDHTCLELFINDGEKVATLRFFSDDDSSIQLSYESSSNLNLTCYSINL